MHSPIHRQTGIPAMIQSPSPKAKLLHVCSFRPAGSTTMIPGRSPFLASALSCAAVISMVLALPAPAGELDDLLNDRGSSATLAESSSFRSRWNSMLDELSQRDYPKADSSLKALEAEKGYVSPRRRDFISLAGRVVRFHQTLESDKKSFRDDYNKVVAGVSEAEAAIKALQLEAAALYERNFNTIPPLTKANMDKRYKQLQEILAERRKAQAAMKEDAKDFEASRVTKLETNIADWIGKDDTEEDVVTGLILSTAYLDRVGDSPHIRTLSQGLSEKQAELAKAARIVQVIEADIAPMTAAGRGEDAQARLDESIAKVESSDQSAFLKKAAVAKLRALRIKVASSTPSGKPGGAVAAAEAAELGKRLDTLERKLSAAQASFGTLVRSIDGFSEFSSDYSSTSDWGDFASSLRQTLKSGKVSKEKMDNMVKAKAEHVGILHEVEILQTESVHLSAVQKGRLANLQATAKTALDLLNQVTQ